MTVNAEPMTPDAGEPPVYRVGRRVGRTVYRRTYLAKGPDDELIGVMDTPELAAAVVAGLNRPNCGCWLCPECQTIHRRRAPSL